MGLEAAMLRIPVDDEIGQLEFGDGGSAEPADLRISVKHQQLAWLSRYAAHVFRMALSASLNESIRNRAFPSGVAIMSTNNADIGNSTRAFLSTMYSGAVVQMTSSWANISWMLVMFFVNALVWSMASVTYIRKMPLASIRSGRSCTAWLA